MKKRKTAKARYSDQEIRRRYRELLKMPQLTDKVIDEMRPHVRLLAQAICEAARGKKVF